MKKVSCNWETLCCKIALNGNKMIVGDIMKRRQWLNVAILWMHTETYAEKWRHDKSLMAECCDIMNVHRNVHWETMSR